MLFYAVLFSVGIVIGSYLNVCICRVHQRDSVVGARLYCKSCDHPLCWYEWIPIFNWLFLKGKCYTCTFKSNVQHFLVEILNGILYILIFAVNGWNMLSILYALMTSALIVLSVIDFRTYEIPQRINGFLLVLGMWTTWLDWEHAAGHLAGLFAVSSFLWLLYVVSKGKAIGGGDIKLMGACGLLLGWKGVMLAFFLGCIIGSVCHLLRMKLWGEGRIVAMGPYLSAGIFLAALWGQQWLSWYAGTFGF